MTEMLKNEPIKGAKTTLWVYTGSGVGSPVSPEAKWARLGNIRELQPGEMQAENEDNTWLDDPDADWKSTSPGQKSVSQVSVTLGWMPGDAGQQDVYRAFSGNQNRTFRIKYPNGTVDIFTGFIASIGKTVAAGEFILRTIKIQPSGKPVSAEELIPALTGLKISGAKTGGKTALTLSGEQGARTAPAKVNEGTLILTVVPIPDGAALPSLIFSSASPEVAVVPESSEPDIYPLKAGSAVITVSGGGFTDKLTLTLS